MDGEIITTPLTRVHTFIKESVEGVDTGSFADLVEVTGPLITLCMIIHLFS